jgi:hypothetical protein
MSGNSVCFTKNRLLLTCSTELTKILVSKAAWLTGLLYLIMFLSAKDVTSEGA